MSGGPLYDCPICGLPAAASERFALDSTDGPVPHVRLLCVRGHTPTTPAGPGEEEAA